MSSTCRSDRARASRHAPTAPGPCGAPRGCRRTPRPSAGRPRGRTARRASAASASRSRHTARISSRTGLPGARRRDPAGNRDPASGNDTATACGQPRQRSVRQPRDRVLLVQHDRDALPAGRQHRGHARVPAHADDHAGAADDGRQARTARRRATGRPQRRRRHLAHERLRRHRADSKPAAGTIRTSTPRRSRRTHLVPARGQLARERQPGGTCPAVPPPETTIWPAHAGQPPLRRDVRPAAPYAAPPAASGRRPPRRAVRDRQAGPPDRAARRSRPSSRSATSRRRTATAAARR